MSSVAEMLSPPRLAHQLEASLEVRTADGRLVAASSSLAALRKATRCEMIPSPPLSVSLLTVAPVAAS